MALETSATRSADPQAGEKRQAVTSSTKHNVGDGSPLRTPLPTVEPNTIQRLQQQFASDMAACREPDEPAAAGPSIVQTCAEKNTRGGAPTISERAEKDRRALAPTLALDKASVVWRRS